MPLIDFAPGLQALGKMFEDKGKMELDLFEREKKIQEENNLLKFNNFMYQTLSQVKDEKSLIDAKTNLFQLANENKILDKVYTQLETYSNNIEKRIQIDNKKQLANDLLLTTSSSGAKYEYNGQIVDVKDIITDMKKQGIPTENILSSLDNMKDNLANYTSSVTRNSNNNYYINKSYKTKNSELPASSKKIIEKNNIAYDEDGIPLTSKELEEYYKQKASFEQQSYENFMRQQKNSQEKQKTDSDFTDRQYQGKVSETMNKIMKYRADTRAFGLRNNKSFNKIYFGTSFDPKKDVGKQWDEEGGVDQLLGQFAQGSVMGGVNVAQYLTTKGAVKFGNGKNVPLSTLVSGYLSGKGDYNEYIEKDEKLKEIIMNIADLVATKETIMSKGK